MRLAIAGKGNVVFAAKNGAQLLFLDVVDGTVSGLAVAVEAAEDGKLFRIEDGDGNKRS